MTTHVTRNTVGRPIGPDTAPLSATDAATPLPWTEDHLRLAIDAAEVALWSWNVDSDRLTLDARSFQLWGLPWAEQVQFETLSAHIHPADRDRVRAAFLSTRSIGGAYEIDFRVVVDRQVRWISARGQGADVGMVNRVMFGVFLDVTGRKQAEEGHELLAGEMSHRVKNLLAIASALTQITSRSAATTTDMSRDLIGRLSALGRAHDLVRPLPGSDGDAVLLGDLFAVLLAPYDDTGAFSGRIRIAVARMGIGERTAGTLALVIHELATNSVKHGALSSEAGALDISSESEGGQLVVTWAETGGPEVDGAPKERGFGSKLISKSLADHLEGSVAYDWQPSGVVATIRVSADRLAV